MHLFAIFAQPHALNSGNKELFCLVRTLYLVQHTQCVPTKNRNKITPQHSKLECFFQCFFFVQQYLILFFLLFRVRVYEAILTCFKIGEQEKSEN